MSTTGTTVPAAVETERESPTRASIVARDFEVVVDYPEVMGGGNEGPRPRGYLLAGQAGCLNVTAIQVAEDPGIGLADLEITIDGEFPLAAFEMETPDERTAAENIDVPLAPESRADRETLQEWGERVEARCPVSDTIEDETGVDPTIQTQ